MGTPQPERPLVPATDDGAETRPALELVVDNSGDQEGWLIDENHIRELYGLSERDLRILGSLATGLVTKQIAFKENTAHHAIGKRLSKIYPRIGVRNMHEAQLWARQELLGEDVSGYDALVRSTRITPRELEVLQCFIDGDTDNYYVASKLYIKHKSLTEHLQRIYRKLGAHSKAEAISKALEIINKEYSIEPPGQGGE